VPPLPPAVDPSLTGGVAGEGATMVELPGEPADCVELPPHALTATVAASMSASAPARATEVRESLSIAGPFVWGAPLSATAHASPWHAGSRSERQRTPVA
jgi:hypothetical protein